MKYNRKKQRKISALILLLLVTIGYALLSTTLKINGTAGIKSNTWGIHWENVQPNNNSTVTAEKPTISENATKVSYEVTLELPGDYYEFTVDAVNSGSINGKISEVKSTIYVLDPTTGEEVIDPQTNKPKTANLPNYINSTVYYDGTTTVPKAGDILEADGGKQTYRIRIEYDEESEVLPETNLSYKIETEIIYTQTKDKKEPPKIPPAVQAKMNQIIADPDTYRNQQQSVSNRDIGLDEDGNVINLDKWVDNDTTDFQGLTGKTYTLDTEKDEIIMSGHTKAPYGDDPDDYAIGSLFVPATSAAETANGELHTPIPAYIMFAGTNVFYPVTELDFLFTNHSSKNTITVAPDLPDTLITIGREAFRDCKIDSIVIPSGVKKIGESAFYMSNINTITYEGTPSLEEIGSSAFGHTGMTGNLTIPKSVKIIKGGAFADNYIESVIFEIGSKLEKIEGYAFDENPIESVTIPSSVDVEEDAFDDDVTIIRN